jgi:hypothetical protein
LAGLPSATNDLSSQDVLNISDNRYYMLGLLGMIRHVIDPLSQPKVLLDNYWLSKLHDMAKRYAFAPMLHNIVVLSYFKSDPADLDYLVYAVRVKDPWLCKHVVTHHCLGDPAEWEADSIEAMGIRVFLSLLHIYRENQEVFEDEEAKDDSEIFEVMERIDWHELLAIEREKPR